MKKYQNLKSYEDSLHPLAQRSQNAQRSFGLSDEENGTTCRSLFARDRDRIIFCKSFRRLMHKTQLYISHEGNEHSRTRLTHTLEVVQIARTITKNLFMNEELVEAIAYGHDVGHTPFGHAGEIQINRFLKGSEPFTRRIMDKIGVKKMREDDFIGDFRHNYQSVRVLTFLEDYHPDYEDNGLNLTIPCLEGILKHTSIAPLPSATNISRDFNFPGIKDGIFKKLNLNCEYSVTIEGQIVSLADEIAQVTHDINDALRIGAITIERLCNIKNVQGILEKDKMRYPNSILNCKNEKNKKQAQLMSTLLNHFINFGSSPKVVVNGNFLMKYHKGVNNPV